jgi:hypothetical protein
VYLPLVAHPGTAQLIAPLSEEVVQERPVTQGATFATRTVAVPASLPTGVAFYLSSNPTTPMAARVDDRIVLKVDGVEVFQYTYGLPPSPLTPVLPNVVVSSLVRVPNTVMQRMAGKRVTVVFMDVYGTFGSASPIYIVGVQR